MFTLLMVTALSAPAQGLVIQPALPIANASGPVSPSFLVVKVKDKNLVSETTRQVQKAVPVVEEVAQPDGTTVKVTKTVVQTVEEKQEITYPIDGTTFVTAGGKTVEAEAALKKLKNPTLVVVSNTGQPVDAAFLESIKSDTLVVIPPVKPIGGLIRPGINIRPLPAPAPAPGVVAPPVIIKPGAIAPVAPIKRAPVENILPVERKEKE
jgi:hypothetical protein